MAHFPRSASVKWPPKNRNPTRQNSYESSCSAGDLFFFLPTGPPIIRNSNPAPKLCGSSPKQSAPTWIEYRIRDFRTVGPNYIRKRGWERACLIKERERLKEKLQREWHRLIRSLIRRTAINQTFDVPRNNKKNNKIEIFRSSDLSQLQKGLKKKKPHGGCQSYIYRARTSHVEFNVCHHRSSAHGSLVTGCDSSPSPSSSTCDYFSSVSITNVTSTDPSEETKGIRIRWLLDKTRPPPAPGGWDLDLGWGCATASYSDPRQGTRLKRSRQRLVLSRAPSPPA